MLGAAIAKPNQLCFGVVGDLSFFYDMNVLGNRHMSPNLRLMIINNGKGVEFRQHINRAAQFEEDTDVYIAAAGHHGNKSRELVRHYAEDLGFTYLSASDKDEYLVAMKSFVSPQMFDKPMVFEVFTKAENEDTALLMARTVDATMYDAPQSNTKKAVKKILGEKGVEAVKKLLNR